MKCVEAFLNIVYLNKALAEKVMFGILYMYAKGIYHILHINKYILIKLKLMINFIIPGYKPYLLFVSSN